MRTFKVVTATLVKAYNEHHAAELAADKEFTKFQITEEGGRSEVILDVKSREFLEYQLKQVSQDIYGLEMSDDRLFSNANGNLPRYENLKKEAKEIAEKLSHLD